jgi:NAD(P)-dependent dehydrogenase (short-subunit alcohol dehydrogenase family)
MTPRQILITGGRRGLGRHLVLHLGAQGHSVSLLGRVTRESLDPALQQIVADCFVADLSDRTALDSALAQAATRMPPIDVLIASAAVRPSGRNLLAYSPGEIRSMMDVNLTAPVLIARSLLPPMIRQGYGRVILIGSRAAFRRGPRETVYAASKAGLAAFAESLSREVDGRNVTANAISPGRFPFESSQETASGGLVIRGVLDRIDSLITSSGNGRIYPVTSWRHRLSDARREFVRAVRLVGWGG